MAIIIRKGTQKDFPILIRLIKDLAAFEKYPQRVKNSIGLMKKEKDLFGFFIAEQNGEAVGTAIYFYSYSTWVGKSLYLEDLYVAPQVRGQKVGTMLLRSIFNLARKEKCKRLRWQVLDWNRNAIAFYKKRGAVITHEWLNCDFDEAAIKRFLKKNPASTTR